VNGNFGILSVNTPQFQAVGMEVTDLPAGDLIRAIPTGTSTCAPIGTAVEGPVQERRLAHLRRLQNQGDCVSFVATGGKNPPLKPSATPR